MSTPHQNQVYQEQAQDVEPEDNMDMDSEPSIGALSNGERFSPMRDQSENSYSSYSTSVEDYNFKEGRKGNMNSNQNIASSNGSNTTTSSASNGRLHGNDDQTSNSHGNSHSHSHFNNAQRSMCNNPQERMYRYEDDNGSVKSCSNEEFEKAKRYVVEVRNRFSNEHVEPTTYSKFLSTLDSYKKNDITVLKAIEQIASLFSEHLDLLKDFSYFVPPESQNYFEEKLQEIMHQHNLCDTLGSININS